MRWLALVGRLMVGGMFAFAAVAYFFKLMTPPPDQPAAAVKMMEVMGPSGWLTVVKVLELVGGVLVLSGRLAPVGLVLLTPVAVNVALWDLCVLGEPKAGVVLAVLCFLLVGYYWKHFAGVFAPARWV